MPGRTAAGLKQAYTANFASADVATDKVAALLKKNGWQSDLLALMEAWPGPHEAFKVCLSVCVYVCPERVLSTRALLIVLSSELWLLRLLNLYGCQPPDLSCSCLCAALLLCLLCCRALKTTRWWQLRS